MAKISALIKKKTFFFKLKIFFLQKYDKSGRTAPGKDKTLLKKFHKNTENVKLRLLQNINNVFLGIIPYPMTPIIFFLR